MNFTGTCRFAKKERYFSGKKNAWVCVAGGENYSKMVSEKLLVESWG